MRRLFSARKLGLSELGFRDSPATSDDRFVSVVAPLGGEVAAYLYIRDDRRGNGPVRADLWIAPHEYPDDRLDRLGVGFRTLLATTFRDPDEAFAKAVAERTRLFLDGAAGLPAAVAREVGSPAQTTDRLPIYRIERLVHATAALFAAEEDGSYLRELFDAAGQLVRKELSMTAFTRVAQTVADRFVGDVAHHDRLTALRACKPLFVREGLKSQAYVEALLA